MYDFYFGSQQEINNDEEKYLLSIKRMLPKWMNSIPDTEFIAINEVSKKVEKKNPVFVETGLGASSIVLLFNVIKNNVSKIFYIEVEVFLKTRFRSVKKINDSYKNNFDKDIFFSYFNNELQIKADLKMENLEDLKHRFDAWIIS